MSSILWKTRSPAPFHNKEAAKEKNPIKHESMCYI